MLRLGDAIELLQAYISANLNAVDRVNQVCERYLKSTDPVGSIELVSFTVTTDANGEGFITLPERYESIRGAVNKITSDSVCGWAIKIRNSQYEYAPGNLGMLRGSDGMRGIIPIPQGDSSASGYSNLRRFKVPACYAVGSTSYFVCLCKRAWLMLTDDDDVLAVWNLGALKMGLKALDKEDAEDYARAEETWMKGKMLLAEESDNQTGSEALGKIQVDDDFELSNLGDNYGGCGYGGYGNGWY